MNALVAVPFLFAMAVAAQPPTLSPAQRGILAAQEQIQKDPKQSQGYNDLAKALVRRGRESGDPDYYRQATRAVADSLKAEPDNSKVVDSLFLSVLGRRPRVGEQKTIARMLSDGSDRADVARDLFWALLNSKEFVFNH